MEKKNRIIIENKQVKTILSEETKQLGYLPIEEARALSHERINKLCQTLRET